MKDKKKRLWMRTAILVLVAATVTYTLIQVLHKNEVIAKGDPAPPFVLENLDGEKVHLKDFRGKGVLLNFWGSWCDPCKEEMPYLNAIHENKPIKGVKIIGINMGESHFIVSNFVNRYDLKFPILLDSNKEVYRKYNVNDMPATFLINKNGQVVKRITGQMPGPKFIKKMMKLVQPDDFK